MRKGARTEGESGRGGERDAPPLLWQTVALEHLERLGAVGLGQRQELVARHAHRVPLGALDAKPFDGRDGEVRRVELE